MSECTNPETGAMLHAWELGVLSDEDRQRFELHLLTCEVCAHEASQFADAAKLLRYDSAFRPNPEEAPERRAEPLSETTRTRRRIARVLLAAAVVLIVAIPVYRMVYSPENQPPRILKLNLVPVRGESENSVVRIPDAKLEIRFFVEGTTSAGNYLVTVKSRDEEPVYQNNRFTGFSESGVGSLVLAMQDLDTGLYSLTVREVADTSAVLQEYNFRVE